MLDLKESGGGTLLYVKAAPNSAAPGIKGELGGKLKVALASSLYMESTVPCPPVFLAVGLLCAVVLFHQVHLSVCSSVFSFLN